MDYSDSSVVSQLRNSLTVSAKLASVSSVSGEAEMRMLLADALQRTLALSLGPLHEALYC